MLEFLIVVIALLLVLIVRMYFWISHLSDGLHLMQKHLLIMTAKNPDPGKAAAVKRIYEVFHG